MVRPISPAAPAPQAEGVRRRMRFLLALLGFPFVLAGFGAAYQAIATQLDWHAYPPPGQLVDVGGYRMHIECAGERRPGVPVVILDASYPATLSSWTWILPQVATVTRVCAYDRSGAGWSDPSPTTPTLGHMAEELHTLLDLAGEPGPYLLVGHSWGGAVARLFAHQHQEQVAGLVLIEALHPDGWKRRGQPESTFGGMPAPQVAAIPFLARVGLFRLFPALRGSWGVVPGLPERPQAELTAYFNSVKWADHVLAVEQAFSLSLQQVRNTGRLDNVPLAIVIGSASENAEGIGLELQRELGALAQDSAEYWVEGADHSSLVHDPRHALQTSAVILRMVESSTTGR